MVFGSVGGGGRYDGLVGRFMKEDVPATGFSIGVSRLQAALSALGKLDDVGASGPVVVLVMDKERVGDYQKMVADLRRADIPAELYLGSAGMKAQMKYADRRDAPLAIIQGGDEKARGVVQIKDMRAGKELADGMADHDAYREARVGQEEVRRGRSGREGRDYVKDFHSGAASGGREATVDSRMNRFAGFFPTPDTVSSSRRSFIRRACSSSWRAKTCAGGFI